MVGVGTWSERLSGGHVYLAQLLGRGSKERAHVKFRSWEQGCWGGHPEAEPAGLTASPGARS